MPSWVLIGDSQAVGLRNDLQPLLAARGYELLGSIATVGWTTKRTYESNQAAALATRNPDLAIVVLGGNDSTGGVYGQYLSRLIDQLREGGAEPQIVWIGPAHAVDPIIAARKDAVADVQRAVLPALNVRWIDGRPMTEDLQHTPDGLHFTIAAQRQWARKIDEQLFGTAIQRAATGIGIGMGIAVAAIAGLWGIGLLIRWVQKR